MILETNTNGLEPNVFRMTSNLYTKRLFSSFKIEFSFCVYLDQLREHQFRVRVEVSKVKMP